MEEVEDKILESDEINTRVKETLRVIKKVWKVNEAMSPKQNDQGISALAGKKGEENATSVSLQSTGPIPVVQPENVSLTSDSGNDQNLQVPGTFKLEVRKNRGVQVWLFNCLLT